jgi:ATP-dependent Lon protease
MNVPEDIIRLIDKKILFFNNAIQSTILNVKMNKINNIICENEYDTCLNLLNELNKKICNITKLISSKEELISQLQNINNDLSSIIKVYGTESFENLLIVCFGSQKYIEIDNNFSKYEILKNYFHPTGYKVLTLNVDTPNFECSDILLTTNHFHTKVYGMKVYIHNKSINKSIVVYGIMDDVIIHLLNDAFINEKLLLIKNNVPKDTLFTTDAYKKYIQSLSLKELLIYRHDEIYNKFVGYCYLYKILKNKSLNNIIKEFIVGDLYSKRNTLLLLIYNSDDYDNAYIANILYDLLVNDAYTIDNQNKLYNSLPFYIRQNFNDIMKKIIENTIDLNKDFQSVSLENKIHLLKVNDNVKEKAFVKLKEIKAKSDDSCSKARQYLDGLLKIPFGIFKKEPILNVMNTNRSLLKRIGLLINKYDELNYTIPIKEKYTNVEINFYIKKINELLEEKIIYKITENDVKTIKNFYTKGDKPELIDNINKINNFINKSENNKIKEISIHNSNNKLYTKQELKKEIISFIDDNVNNILLTHNLYNLMLNGTSFCNSKYDLLITDLNKIKNNFEDIKKYFVDVKTSLDKSVYGHENAKREIEKIIGQWINGENTGYCFGFEGCPGVGKTSLAKKGISDCLKDENGESRPFAFIKMGGDSNGSTLHGHNYTYVGSTWGSIVQILMDTQVMNPIIYIDEVDKISKTENGKELIGILTHLLDFTQNDSFQDKYFNGININLSKVLFILSYNDPSSIDRVLLDRIHRIKFNHLSLNDKLTIVKKHLLPEILVNMGLDGMIHLEEEAIKYLIETYTIEPGVRKLKELLFDIVGEINLHIFKDTFLVESFPIYLGINDIKKYMKDKFEMIPQRIEPENKIGIINGMWANALGQGGILQLYAKYYPCNNFLELKLTGSLEKVMSESIHVAETLAFSLLSQERKDYIYKENKSFGIHIHAAEGAVSKDGPSGGVALTSLIYSLLNDYKIKQNFGITGEIDLNGNVCEIGGLDMKILGSIKSGVTSFIFPKKNLKDYDKLVEKYKDSDIFKDMNFYSVSTIQEVFELIYDR